MVRFVELDFYELKQLVGVNVIKLDAEDVFLEPRKSLNQLTEFFKLVRLPIIRLRVKLKQLYELFKLCLVLVDVFDRLFSFDAQNSVEVKVGRHELLHVTFSKGLLAKLLDGLVKLSLALIALFDCF